MHYTNGSRPYNGKPVSDADIANSGIKVDINIPSQPTQSLVLNASDFNWNSNSSVPSKVGAYTLTLNESGIAKIKSKYSELPFIKWVDNESHSTITGTAQFSIVDRTETFFDTRTVTETIHYQDTEGNQLADDVVKSVTFNRSGVKDTLTNKVTWGAWTPAGSQEIAAVKSPTISGYTPNVMEVPAYEVNADSTNKEVTVIYTKNSSNEPVTPTKPEEPTQPTTPTNPETPSQPEITTNPVENINNDDHVNNTVPVSNEKIVINNQQNKELPQTGNNETIALGGLLLAGLATSFGFGGLKKKNE